MDKYDWLEFKFRPKKDGLHDSGYRFIQLVGVTRAVDGALTTTELHQWADHLVLNGPANIDVEEDGTVRIMAWSGGGGWVEDWPGFRGSDAMFRSGDMDAAIRRLELERDLARERA